MASKEILKQKEAVVAEISERLDNAKTFLLLNYQGLTVSEIAELRRELRNNNSEVKIYKNTLLKRALDSKNINLDSFLEGPNAVIFGATVLEPIKVLSNFQKEHENAKIQTGVINGEVVTLDTIKEYVDPDGQKHKAMVQEICKRLNFTSLAFKQDSKPFKLFSFIPSNKEQLNFFILPYF